MKNLAKSAVIWVIGGLIYGIVESLWRGYTHWTMILLAAVLSIPLDAFNERIGWDWPLWLQAVTGGTIVTVGEFVAGVILNLWLGLGIWDYSGIRGNLLGQICVQFWFAWCGLSLVAIVLFDFIRYRLFGEDRPSYHFF